MTWLARTIALALTPAAAYWAPAARDAVLPYVEVASAPATTITVAAPFATVPPAPWSAEDPADSLYRTARSALNDGDFRRAASLYRQIADRYPRSTYAADAYYWEAFARYRIGSEGALRDALARLDAQRTRFPQAATRGDAETLATQIRGELARRGDSEAAARVAETAAGKGGSSGAGGAPCPANRNGDESTDQRIAALNALMQMDPEQAMPILREVLARRDACSEALRRKAVWLVAQKNTPDAADILLRAAQSDPDAEVREQAVFWLSQVHSERAVPALDSILRRSSDQRLREKAIFALSQQSDPRARSALRDFAQSSAPANLRGKAVFWLGQNARDAETAAFLRTLYGKAGSEDMRDQIVQALANVGGTENDQFLLGIVKDPKQDLEARKKAVFWLGQQRRVPVTQLITLYGGLPDREMKEQLIWVLSQRRESEATDKLIDIARNDSDRALRGKAVFWLGQKNDPRVKQLLMEIINQ